MSVGEGVAGAVPRERDAAVTALFAAHYRRLVGIARLLVDDTATAEDVVQDAFVGVYARWPWIRDKSSAVGYLETSVVNGARSNLRRRRTARLLQLPTSPDEPSAEATAVVAESSRALRHALAALPLRQRQVLVLRFYLDRPEADIAATLGISTGSVKQHASRALAALSSHVERSS